jgi:hypothetical protein
MDGMVYGVVSRFKIIEQTLRYVIATVSLLVKFKVQKRQPAGRRGGGGVE